MSDIRTNLTDALDTMDAQVTAMTEQDWSQPTVCTGWDAHAVLDHVTGTLVGIKGMIGGQEYRASKQGVEPLATPAESVARWRELSAAVRQSAQALDPEQPMEGPFGAGPAQVALVVPTGDIATHAWDLADSRGERLELPDGLVEMLENQLRNSPMEQLRAAGLFGPEATPPADATRTERMLAIAGRAPGLR